MSKFALGTSVAASKTQGEIMGLLGGRGVQKMATMNEPMKFTLAFEYEGVAYRISLPTPDPEDDRFWLYKRGSVSYRREDSAAQKQFEDELNRRWRAFGMVIKAKIVAVEEGISTMEDEFIGNAVMPNGMTVSEMYSPNLRALAQSGKIPALTMGGGA